jgi:hydroxyacylglutathione hydrolase
MQSVFEVLSVPGHTEGHIAYFGHGSLFCGDTLFLGGCGRVFTGTFEQLSTSLQVISKLPENTKVYCAHEYTLANLGFGLWVEPDNEVLKQRHEAVSLARQNNIATVPGVLSEELQTNPFLRTDNDNVIMAAENWAAENWPGKNSTGKKLKGQADVFTALRQWKDQDYD